MTTAVVIAALIAANAFFVAAEYALITARRRALTHRTGRGARTALRLMDDPVRVISTVQIAITALGIALGAVGEAALSDVLEPVLALPLAFAVSFAVVTFLSVWLGELVPKALALDRAERVAAFVALPIDLCGRLFAPVVWLLQRCAELVLRPLGIPAVSAGERLPTREELPDLLAEVEAQGELRADEEDMLAGIIALARREVRDVMIPWEGVETLAVRDGVSAARERVLASSHTRHPLVGDGGEILGVVHARDLWAPGAAADLPALARSAVIVPPTLAVDQLLRRLRRERRHLAVVVSEYGAPMGIATLEDVLEEIVGEIEDEFDTQDVRVRRDAGAGFLVDGGLSLADLRHRTGLDLRATGSRTVGGALADALGRAAREGDEAVVAGAVLTAVCVDGPRAVTVRVCDEAEGASARAPAR